MSTPNDGSNLRPEVLQKLNEIRNEDRRIRFRAGLLRGLAIFLTAMLTAMAVDWLTGVQNPHWRWTLTLLALACGGFALLAGCVLPMLKKRSLASVAQQVDRAHPSAEERFLTLTALAESSDAPELRGSPAMLEKVSQQAAAMSASISPASVISRAGLVRAAQYFGGTTAVLLLLFALNFQQTKVLFERFWSPGSDITMTRLTAKTGDLVVGKGDDVTLEITASGRVPKSADLYLRSAGRTDVISLEPNAPKDPRFLYAVNGVSDSFDYRAQAGDGDTAWHHVTVVDRPRISQVSLRVVPPAYSQLPEVNQKTLPRQIRALEGSQLEVSFQSDQPLASMELKFADGKTQAITKGPDDTYRFKTTLTNTLAFTPVFTNLQNLDNAAKPTCKVVVYQDQPPVVNVISPKSEITARPDDKVKIDFEAHDDFGVAKTELVVTVKNETNSVTTVTPIPLAKNEAGAKKIRKQIELDLGKLNLKQDQELSYYIRATDTKENSARSATDQQNSTPQDAQPKPDADNSSTNSPASPQKNGNKTAGADKKDSTPQDKQKHLAMNQPPSKPKEPSEGNQPPPNNMSKRVLDAGQCSCCSPMKITVDQWGRSFEGQMREKLEIAIDPVLKLLDQQLGKAQLLAEDTLAIGQKPEGLSEKESPAMEAARDYLRKSDTAVTDLKKICHDTPYAFISLQIDDIRDTHISPARKNLADVALESTSLKGDITNLQQGDFQIKEARQKLADLTKMYEAVKRDTKVADAMQRLAKMHQIFLEDTQAMLGASKPPLNPQQRKVAEVSDEYAEKLRKLLEEKKKILAELSKVLANDPRMLRRFLALQELEGTTLRDQMTLLAERQQALAKQSAQWSATNDKTRADFLKAFLAAQAVDQGEIAALTSKLLENMVTWAPLDVPVDKEPIAGCRNLAAEAARLAGDATKLTTPEAPTAGLASASNALEQLRSLQAALPGLDWIASSKEKVSVFEANRLNDTAELITRQSGWIKKMESIKAGDFAQAAEVDQHRLMLDTTTLSEKLDTTAISLASLSEAIKAKADELNGTMHKRILPEESGATAALAEEIVPVASSHQFAATNAFATGEKQFDDLLHMIIAKLDAEPPPTDPGGNQSLEEILAMLDEEKKACEKLGVPCRPINVSVLKDWMKASSCSNPGSAQARAAQAQAKDAKAKAQKASDKAKQLVVKRLEQLPPPETPRSPKSGPKPPPSSWNTLVSQLGDELRQGRDNVPPEQYRQAIEQYFTTISEKPAEAQPAAGH